MCGFFSTGIFWKISRTISLISMSLLPDSSTKCPMRGPNSILKRSWMEGFSFSMRRCYSKWTTFNFSTFSLGIFKAPPWGKEMESPPMRPSPYFGFLEKSSNNLSIMPNKRNSKDVSGTLTNSGSLFSYIGENNCSSGAPFLVLACGVCAAVEL